VPAEVTLVSCDIAVKALSNDVTLSPALEADAEAEAEADGDADVAADAEADADGDAEAGLLLHPAAMIETAATAANSVARVFTWGLLLHT
jgi:hypothetical protein